MHDGFESILTKDALGFLAQLHYKFNRTRKELLAARDNLQKQIDVGTQIKVESHFGIQFRWTHTCHQILMADLIDLLCSLTRHVAAGGMKAMASK